VSLRFRRWLLALGVLSAAGGAARGETLGSTLYVPSDVYNAAPGEQSPKDVEAAEAEFQLARDAVAAEDVPRALRHACRAVSLDANHAEARRLLGYQRVGDQWTGGYAKRMLDSGHVWRREYGWIKAEDEAKYADGLRPWGTRWISAAEDAQRHATVDRGWTVRTDHFIVTTNVDRAAGSELAVRLETIYQLWRQLFGGLELPPAELKARLDGKHPPGFLNKAFRVTYHRNRDEYNAALRRRQPQIDVTLGIYFDAQRESHFFAGNDQDPGTIAHEAVHQIFYESAPRQARHLAALANVWAVEGAACYFESLDVGDDGAGGAYTIGMPAAGRLPAARHRRLVDDYYVPLAELSALGMTDLQARDDIARLYSQSAGLASFFMDYDGGRYRQAFGELLRMIYAGRDNAGSLAELTGTSYGELDREYLQFMRELPSAANP
jgi:hypothetical protein